MNGKILYAVTDRKQSGAEFYRKIECALEGGVKILQLREKNLSEDSFLAEAVFLKKLCSKFKVPLIINDNLSVAIKSGADGVHVGAEDISVSEVKRLAPKLIVGATAKTLSQAKEAEEAGADYLGVGAVFPSPTKPNAIPVSRELLEDICLSVKIPVFAIGGITEENLFQLDKTGISGVAVCSSLFCAEDVFQTAQSFCRKLREIT